jgi:uncharacterized protein
MVDAVDSRGPADDGGAGVRARLRLALSDALRARDMVAVSAVRSALSAISNAEAVNPGSAQVAQGTSPYVAGAAAGLGAGEARRRSLSAAEVSQIIGAEIAERQRAAREYEQAGHAGQARRLRGEIRVLIAVSEGKNTGE